MTAVDGQVTEVDGGDTSPALVGKDAHPHLLCPSLIQVQRRGESEKAAHVVVSFRPYRCWAAWRVVPTASPMAAHENSWWSRRCVTAAAMASSSSERIATRSA